MNHRVSSTLAATAQGQAYYCACEDRITMRFKERRFAFERAGLPAFREGLCNLLKERDLLRGLIREALDEAANRGLSTGSMPTPEDLEEMLGLVDSAVLVLEAQEIVAAQD